MAKQKSIFKLDGTIGGVTFYKSKDGYMAKENNAVSGDRIKTDPVFQRTRENMSEFGRAAKAGKTLRNALRTLMQGVKDNRVTSRLTKRMLEVVKSDVISQRGLRNLVDGDIRLAEGFEFNENAQLNKTLFAPYTTLINRVTGDISVSIPSFVPLNSFNLPAGATHFQINAAGLEVDFANDLHTTKEQSSAYIKLDVTPTAPLNLVNTVTANSTSPLFAVLGIQFFQYVNGNYYPLKDGSYNVLTIVKVDG